MTVAERRVSTQVAAGDAWIDLMDLPPADRMVSAVFLDHLLSTDGGLGRIVALHLKGAHVTGKLDLSFRRIDTALAMYECHFDEAPRLGRTTIPALDLIDCRVPGMWANSIKVAGSLCLDRLDSGGPISLIGCEVGDDLVLDGAKASAGLDAPVISLYAADIGSNLSMSKVTLHGLLRLAQATVGATLVMDEATLTSPQTSDGTLMPALDATGLSVAGQLNLQRTNVWGEVLLADVSVGRSVDLTGSTVENPRGDAITLDGSRVRGDLTLEGVTLTGTTRLIGAEIAGTVHIRNAHLQSDVAESLVMDGAVVEGVLSLHGSHVGAARLFQARVTGLDDDLGHGEDGLGSWSCAQPLDLRGFVFQQLNDEPESAVASREKWLRRTESYDPAIWRTLSKVYSSSGQDALARRVNIAQENDRLARMPRGPRKLGRWALRILIGHGYRPERSLVWGAGVVALLAGLVASRSHELTPKPPTTRDPQPIVYAMDVFLPIIDFGEASRFDADGMVLAVQWLVIALGWALSSLFVAAFSQTVRKPA